MSLMHQILFRISAYCRCRIINGPDQLPYLERYHLLKLPFGYQFYLHRFVASDPGRGLHNHPWNRALSLVLCGEYEEVRMADSNKDNCLQRRRIRVGRLNWINGSVFHRINLSGNSETWTIFLHGPKAKSWGFLQNRDNRYAFHDHDRLLKQASNPLWWKTASRPVDDINMRKPSSGSMTNHDLGDGQMLSQRTSD
jgi:hypothetical protein